MQDLINVIVEVAWLLGMFAVELFNVLLGAIVLAAIAGAVIMAFVALAHIAESLFGGKK